jgi:hypothetical protein
VDRISSSAKRMSMPSLVESSTSRWPSVRRAAITSSPSSSVMAWMPPRLGCENATSSVFLTFPRLVASRIYAADSKSRTGTQVATASPSASESTFTMALPLAWRPPSGISWTLSQWTLPLFVKNRR